MPTIVQNISPALIEGATAIYIGGVRASALDASGNVLIDGNATPPTQTAPTITAQPTISGTTAPTGLLTLSEGAASGNPVPTGTIQWYLDGVALIGENGLTIDKGQHGVGVYRATVIWANGVIPAATGQSNAITVAAQQTAPSITTQPTISGGTAIGDILTLARGAATGNPAPTATYQWYRNGAVLSGEDGLTLDTGGYGAGVYRAVVTWSNGVAPVATSQSNTITVEAANAPGIDYSRAIAYIDADTPFTGTASDVTAVTSTGLTSINWPATGTGNPITHSAAGFTFANGVYLQSSMLSGMPTGDGIFVVVDFTLTSYGSSNGQLFQGSGDRIILLDTSATLRVQGVDDANATMDAGATPYGTRFVIGGRMDDVLNTLAMINVAGAYSEQAHATTDPALTRMITGRYLNGTLHRLAVFGRPEGGAWPVSFEDVYADFQAGA